MKKFALVLLILFGQCLPNGLADSIREALVNLCDPAKIATITSDRGANPRVRKIAYWLEMARREGREPASEMQEVMVAVGWGGSAKGDLTADAMVRNRMIAERLGCLNEEGLQAAVGYLELGMFVEANDEIENLSPEVKNSSPVLGVRLKIYRDSKKWELMQIVARELCRRHRDCPVYWNDLAWAARRALGIFKAFEILSEAVEKFPEDAMTNFNLGCYHCQMGEIEKAKEHVGKAIKLDRHFRILALDDVDLEPLWQEWKL